MPTTTGTIKHRFQTTKSNRGTVDVSKDRWNDSLVVAGGTDGYLMVRDSANADGWGMQVPPTPYTPPQSIGTTDTPQFARLGLGIAADANARLKINGQYGSPLYDNGNSGTAKTIDWNNGNDQYLTLTGNCTLTLSNPMSGFRYALFINTGAGGFTPTFPGSIIWMDAVPTLPTTASKIYVAVMVYIGPLSSYTTNFTKQP